MEKLQEKTEFVQKNLPCGDFLQSDEWRKFQESVGRKTHNVSGDCFFANIIEHNLPVVGTYFYCPHGPVLECGEFGIDKKSKTYELIELAKKENAGWIRIDPATEEILQLIKKNVKNKITKAPHDMQPRENFVIDISKTEEELLAEMKSKTRYNVRLAQKQGVKVVVSDKKQVTREKCMEEFLMLTKEMAKRQGINTHPEEYYEKMFESLPEDMLKLYCAEYDGKIIAANLVLFYRNSATYLHGASSNENRNVMAPYLLQWQAILNAKKQGCAFYDFGGIKTHSIENEKYIDWAGITKFKLGFSPNTKPVVFLGSYDMVMNKQKYLGYKFFSLLFGLYKNLVK